MYIRVFDTRYIEVHPVQIRWGAARRRRCGGGERALARGAATAHPPDLGARAALRARALSRRGGRRGARAVTESARAHSYYSS